MLTLCPNFITTRAKIFIFRLHLDLRDWKPFRQNTDLRKFSETFGRLRKIIEVAVTFSEIPVMTIRKSHAFDSEKVGRYTLSSR